MKLFPLLATSFALFLPFTGSGQSRIDGSDPRTTDITFIKDRRVLTHAAWQAELRQGQAWSGFVAQHPGWTVEFNESTGKPRRAFGPGIPVAGATPVDKALIFAEQQLAAFELPLGELVHRATAPAKGITYVHFGQVHLGRQVLLGKYSVKLDAQGRVIAFGADLHTDFPLDLEPLLSSDQTMAIAAEGLSGVVGSDYFGERILSLPGERDTDHRIVHDVEVRTMGKRPGKHRCWVDARSGELLYRQDQVVSEHDHGHGADDDAADVQVNGQVHVDGALQPATVEGLPDLRVSVNGNFLFTDATGFLPTGVTGPVAAQYALRGRWSQVFTNGSTPSFNGTLNEGSNTVNFSSGNVRERTAYYHVSKIHNHCNEVLPDFTGMDIVLPTNVDVTGDSCNAYYDGASINFYAQSATCRALSLYGDVIYHEYGHGINDKFYQSLGSVFNNGAMNEGYADVWAITLTQNPVMTLGYNIPAPNSYIRRYDATPKVYPVDIVGEVHRDGEIIAGAWWDTYRLLGWDMPLTLQLFADAFPGLQADVPAGQEGQAYRDVLLDVLQADDDDGDLTNGTPHGEAIAEAFAIHGITLLSNSQFNHTPVPSALEGNGIPINATLALTFPFNTYVEGASLHYKVSNSQPWVTVPMNISGSNYSAQIPPQPGGTIVAYYLTVDDIYDVEASSASPAGAQFVEAGYLPNYILVGFNLIATEDGDDNSQLGNWTTSPQGNATTGQWEYGVLIGSYGTPGVPSTIVQPAQQHTPGGFLCWYTGNAAGTTSALGENDVDGGSTILVSDPINLTGYTNPAFTYWRWYSNNSGANPGTDWWQVQISNNNGSSWVNVENTKTSDRSWRRKAFRVQEYVTPTASVRLRFIASDSIRPNVQQNGGSLVEGALDDIQLWNGALNTLGEEELKGATLGCFPIPAADVLNVVFNDPMPHGASLQVLDLTGRMVLTERVGSMATGQMLALDVRSLGAGQYLLRSNWTGGASEQRFSVLR